MIVSLMLVSDERAWLESELRGAAAEAIVWEVLEAGLGAIPFEGVLAIAAESARAPRLASLVRAAVDRLGEDRCALLIWADGRNPDLRTLRGCTPKEVIYLPSEVERLLAWAEGGTGPGKPADLEAALRVDLADALGVALRFALNRSREPSGPPPPGTVAELARSTGLDRANLHRRAKQWNVDLPAFLRHARVRWVLALYRRPEDLADVVRELGHTDDRPLRRLLQATLERPLAKAWGLDPELTIGPILTALGRAATLADRG
jgi:hypothetical protein